VTVELAVVPHEQQHMVVIASPVRKPAAIVAAWLQSLAWQVIPRGVQPFYLFIDDGCDPDARALLDQFVVERGGLVWNMGGAQPDFSDVGATHMWSHTAMNRVGAIKDKVLEFARVNRAEAVWLVDADLICDPMTLTSLWSVPEPVVSGVYWTAWSKVPAEHPPVHSGPQVWLQHPYGLAGRGMEEWEFRRRLIDRQLTEVGGLGACTLIRREALVAGVSFAPWPGNTLEGIGQGEDRHFCMRASALHLRLMADPWPDIFHIYHRPEDEALIPEYLGRLANELVLKASGVGTPYETGNTSWVQKHPVLGDLVSLRLHALEPVLTGTGWMHPPQQLVRGRLGKISLHPELEDAILDMTRGEVRVVPVHFGLDYPFPPYRGQRRLIQVTLIDHKPFGYAPVIERELIVNRTGAGLDTTTCTPELLDQMREIHA
jgi:hypothetical protein